jgi:hypothetical protein
MWAMCVKQLMFENFGALTVTYYKTVKCSKDKRHKIVAFLLQVLFPSEKQCSLHVFFPEVVSFTP